MATTNGSSAEPEELELELLDDEELELLDDEELELELLEDELEDDVGLTPPLPHPTSVSNASAGIRNESRFRFLLVIGFIPNMRSDHNHMMIGNQTLSHSPAKSCAVDSGF